MSTIKIRKGHNLRIAGVPGKKIKTLERPGTVGLNPSEFLYVKPKLLVKEGDSVKIGSALFFDKRNPEVKWAAPAAGVVKAIQYGERRIIKRIEIELNQNEQSLKLPSFSGDELSSLGKERITSTLLEANLWPLIKQRPFNKVANPNDDPRDIFISGLNTAPLSPDLDLVLAGCENDFQAGLDVLRQLTPGAVHLTVAQNASCPALTQAKNITLHRIQGPHPAGNVGIQIHHIDPLKPHEVVWTINTQQVLTIGRLFLTGEFDPAVVVSLGGPALRGPVHVRTRMGVAINTLLNDQLTSGEQRIISGDVLTGKQVNSNGFLGFYDTTVSVIPVTRERPFLGWLKPGSTKTHYSLTNSYLTLRKKFFNFTTLQNGSRRALVPINAWEDLLPMDILPNPLYRSILAQDIEEMEKLGILECDDEDFALCTFACPSKINLGETIRRGLDLMEKEG